MSKSTEEWDMEVDEEGTTDDENDPVVEEIPIVIIPTKDNDTVNRIQFPTREIADLKDCVVKFKAHVGHLQIESLKGKASKDMVGDDDEPGPSTNMTGAEDRVVYEGVGHADHEVLDYAVGFFKDGAFCLLPIENTYEMRRTTKKKAQDGKIKMPKKPIKTEAKPELKPARMKFERSETDAQKKARENSAFHKQKLVEQDPWINMEVTKIKPQKVYDNLRLETGTDPMADVNVSLKKLV